MRWRVLLVTIVLAAAGCASSSPTATPSTTSTTSSSNGTTTSASTRSTTTTTAFAGDTKAVDLPATSTTAAAMTALRVAHQAGFDRVVFEFAGSAAPSVKVDYDDNPTADASGAALAVAGTVTLHVRMFPANSFDYRGSARVRGDTTQVTEVVRGGDFEAVLTWYIGLNRRAPFRVTVLSNPTRVVVDVAAS